MRMENRTMVNKREEDQMKNIEPNEGREIARRLAKQWMQEADLVPLTLIALEVAEPLDLIADRFSGEVVLDDVGMRSVPAATAAQFFAERAKQTARMQEQSRRLGEAHKPLPVGRGVPALSDASPFESLMAGDSSYVKPQDEFGRPRPNFMADELEQGARQAAAERAEIGVRKGKDR